MLSKVIKSFIKVSSQPASLKYTLIISNIFVDFVKFEFNATHTKFAIEIATAQTILCKLGYHRSFVFRFVDLLAFIESGKK